MDKVGRVMEALLMYKPVLSMRKYSFNLSESLNKAHFSYDVGMTDVDLEPGRVLEAFFVFGD